MTTVSDWELWACAQQQVRLHGDDAAIRAAERADALLVDGDFDGHRVWLAILRRIDDLGGVIAGATRH